MSVILVRGVPVNWSLKEMVRRLVRTIRGKFSAISFGPYDKKTRSKSCYLRLSEFLDPIAVVETINRIHDIPNNKARLHASIPNKIPDLPAVTKDRHIPKTLSRILHIGKEDTYDKVIVSAFMELLCLMQMKYPGLRDFSEKNGHKLMDAIAQTICERLKKTAKSKPDLCKSTQSMTRQYRFQNPHEGDFELILSHLHKIEEAEGRPKSNLVPKDLEVYINDSFMGPKTIIETCNTYSARISHMLKLYIAKLECTPNELDTVQEAARKTIRAELKKISMYLKPMIYQVLLTNLTPKGKKRGNLTYIPMRMYGEPHMPNTQLVIKFLKKYKALKIFRSSIMYNLMHFSVPNNQYVSIMAMDGTAIGGAKQIIRPLDSTRYVPPQSMLEELRAVYGVSNDDNQEMDFDYENEMEVMDGADIEMV